MPLSVSKLQTVDLVILGLYFAVTMTVGLWVARRTQGAEDLFLAGRQLRWAAIGFSLFASNISSTTLIGLAGQAYATGISVDNYEWMAAVILVFFVAFYVPIYIRARITTVPEYLERRFDRRSRVYFSTLTILANIIVDTAGSLYAGAVVLRIFFPSLSVLSICAILAVATGIYTAAGGLAAVVYTDVLQAGVFITACSFIAFTMFGQLGFSWERIQEVATPDMLSLIRPIDDPTLPWLGTLIGVPVLGFYFWCTNQFMVQRVLAAKSVDHARWGSLLAGFLKLPVLFIMVFPGVMARRLLPDLPRPDMVFPAIVTELLPAGAVGLVLAGLVAALMGATSSTLNSASTLVVVDFIAPRYPNLDQKALARIGRITVCVFMVLSACWAPMIEHFTGLFAYLQQVLSYLVPPVAAVFIMGVFVPRVGGRAAFVTLLGGHTISAIAFALTFSGILKLHFTIVAGLLFVLSCVVCLAVSFAKPEAVTPQAALLHQKVDALPGSDDATRAWWKDYRVQSGVLLAMTTALVIWFW